MFKLFLIGLMILSFGSVATENEHPFSTENSPYSLHEENISARTPLLMEEIKYDDPARIFVITPIICCPFLICCAPCLLDGEVEK